MKRNWSQFLNLQNVYQKFNRRIPLLSSVDATDGWRSLVGIDNIQVMNILCNGLFTFVLLVVLSACIKCLMLRIISKS